MPTLRRHALVIPFALTLSAAVAQEAPAPAGAWVAASIGGTPVPPLHRADITFTAVGQVHGTTGCNRFMGGFTLDGGTLRFSPIAGTRMACEPTAMDQEMRFHEALSATRGWRPDGPALLLTNDAGDVVLRLVR